MVGPCAISCPKSSTYSRVVNSATNSTSCSTSKMANPRSLWMALRVAAKALVSSRSSPEDGSSSSKILGSVISARPTSTRRPCPRLKDSIGTSATSASPSNSSTASQALISAAVGLPRPNRSFQKAPLPLRTRSAMSRCSRTVVSLNSSIRWNVRPIPACARL